MELETMIFSTFLVISIFLSMFFCMVSGYFSHCAIHWGGVSSMVKWYAFPETNIAPKNRHSQKDIHLPTSNRQFSGALLVSGRVIIPKRSHLIHPTTIHFKHEPTPLWFRYTTWKVVGATPIYWFIMDPYWSTFLGVAPSIYFHHGVVKPFAT